MTLPTFLWLDTSGIANSWRIDVAFDDGSAALHQKARGELMQIGEIDQDAVGTTNELLKLTAQEANTRTWTPDPET